MASKTPLRLRMETLKVKGVPLLVKSPIERINAFNIANGFGWEIQTRKRIGTNGYEIHRLK